MDLAALPPAALWRWDLGVRMMLAVLAPVGASMVLFGELTSGSVAAVMSAALVSFASLGPDLSSRTWVAVAAIGVPVAMVLGVLSARLGSSGALLVFVLFTVHGAMVRTGLLAQLAWFPVSLGGMLAALLATGTTGLAAVGVGAVLGSMLAVGLIVGVPLVVRAPRLPIPPEALALDTSRLRRMATEPRLRDWLFPLALGGLSAGLLLVTTALTGGFKPYWSVIAFVSVLAPSSAKTRASAIETVVASLVGVALTAAVLRLGLPQGLEVFVIVVLGVAGALLILRNGMLSKALLTPLPVVIAVAALDVDGALALPLRVLEFVVGAALGLATVVVADYLGRRLWRDRDRDRDEPELVG